MRREKAVALDFVLRDYQEQPELDQYSDTGIDDTSDVEDASINARRAAEREMDMRDDRADEDDLFYDEDDRRVRREGDERERGMYNFSLVDVLFVVKKKKKEMSK